ncbi:hypothetical protein AB0O82_10795 [Kitasatospora sp. NPDC088264]|uniref:hypothetical protein n=1 Tax=Kitasatospora sp. NPDC088264 TaxID=3155296 RepID=UPI003441E22B
MTSARIAPHLLGRNWLAGVSSNPHTITDRWRSGSAALVQLSCRFDAILVAGADLTSAVVAELHTSGVPLGPVLYDHGDRVSFWLVPVRPGLVWQMNGTMLLTGPADGGEPPSLLMPAPVARRVGQRQWLVPPDGSGHLTRHEDLAVALRRVRRGHPTSAASGGPHVPEPVAVRAQDLPPTT